MSKLGFVLKEHFDAPPATVREFLADLGNLSSLHPLIESITELPSRADRPGARFHRVVDRIPIGPFRLRTEYTAALEIISDSEIRGDAWQRPRVRLHTVYELRPTDRGTQLVERVQVSAPFGLGRFVVSQARAAHRVMLARMRDRLASPA